MGISIFFECFFLETPISITLVHDVDVVCDNRRYSIKSPFCIVNILHIERFMSIVASIFTNVTISRFVNKENQMQFTAIQCFAIT